MFVGLDCAFMFCAYEVSFQGMENLAGSITARVRVRVRTVFMPPKIPVKSFFLHLFLVYD